MSAELNVTKTAKAEPISAVFARCRREDRVAVMPFLTAGFPDLKTTDDLLDAVVEGGADLIELGVPFSDPLADGATVQRTSQIALENGVSLDDCFALVQRFRERGYTTPVVLMGYVNPFLQYGPERLAKTAKSLGVNGFIIPDLPIEESDEFRLRLKSEQRDLIFMVAPTSTDARIAAVAAKASGFIYCVSLTGVTGARDSVSQSLPAYIERVRSHSDIPLAIGFGISKPEHVREVATFADGVIVASALINYLESLEPDQWAAGATSFVGNLSEAAGKPAGV